MSWLTDPTLTIQELVDHLNKFPPETRVYYRDENFGGRSEPTTPQDFTLEGKFLLIRSPWWQDCNEEDS